MKEVVVQAAAMGTVVSIRVVGTGLQRGGRRDLEGFARRALAWFHRVESCCSRFDEASELRGLARAVGHPVAVSPMLYHAVEFALRVAEETDGAFDPTVGVRMEAEGYARDYRSGRPTGSGLAPDPSVRWRDVRLDPHAGTITLERPLVLDLGAVAKGLAIDLAAKELEAVGDFTIDAGGDLWLGGRNGEGLPWTVGIRHPRDPERLIESLQVSDRAVCTSGDYERGRHILDGRGGGSADRLASVSVVARSAMVADALGTAAFALGPAAGIELLERHGLDALLVTPSLDRLATGGERLFRSGTVPAARRWPRVS